MSSLGSASYKDILDEFKYFSEYKDKLSNINEIQIEIKVWNKLKSKNSSEAYKQYLKEYPNGVYINEAKKLCMIAEDNEAWQKAKKENTQKAYEEYLNKFKEPIHEHRAKGFIDTFRIAKWLKIITIFLGVIIVLLGYFGFLFGVIYAFVISKIVFRNNDCIGTLAFGISKSEENGCNFKTYMIGFVGPVIIYGFIREQVNIDLYDTMIIGSLIGSLVAPVILETVGRELD